MAIWAVCAWAAHSALAEGYLVVRLAEHANNSLPTAVVRVGKFTSQIEAGDPNSDGARFPRLPAGEYAIEVEAEGFQLCFPVKVRIRDDEDLSVVLWMQRVPRMGTPMPCVIPPLLPTQVEVTEPTSPKDIAVGRPIRIAWRVVNAPPNPTGWQVYVGIYGCAEEGGIEFIHVEPLVSGRSSFIWKPSKKVIAWMRRCKGCQFPIMVCLYHPEAGDDAFAELMVCHAAGGDYWLVCGTTYDGHGRVRVGRGSK